MAPSVKVVAKLVDGSAMNWDFPPAFLLRLDSLEAAGYRGRRLIEALLTDDWGPPPVLVTITGTHPNGLQIARVVEYD